MIRRSEVVLGRYGAFDLASPYLGRGYRYESRPSPGDYITLAVFRRPYRLLRRGGSGALRPDPYFDLYINVSRHTFMWGGTATSRLRWAHGEFFQLLSRGDVRVVGAYVVLTRSTPVVLSYHALGDLPVTTSRFTTDYHPDRPVPADFAYPCDLLSPDVPEPWVSFDFSPWRVCVSRVEVR